MNKFKKVIAYFICIVFLCCSIENFNTLDVNANNADNSFALSGVCHVQNEGDTYGNIITNDGVKTLILGTRGKSQRVEEITVNFTNNTSFEGDLQYRVHIQNTGWSSWVSSGTKAGSRGKSLRLEGIEMRLTGELAKHYSVRYSVHIQNYGDAQGWIYDGALAGTTGESKRLEEVRIQIVPRENLSDVPEVAYRVHRQTYGWEKTWATNGAVSGTTGESKRLEGITITVNNSKYQGGIEYRTHIQNLGWESEWIQNGRMSGTSGRSFRLEAIQIKLTGELANNYSVYYRVHAQNFGWMGWACDGEESGTAGYSYRLEAIQIVLLPKGSSAPRNTYGGITATTTEKFSNKNVYADTDTYSPDNKYWDTNSGENIEECKHEYVTKSYLWGFLFLDPSINPTHYSRPVQAYILSFEEDPAAGVNWWGPPGSLNNGGKSTVGFWVDENVFMVNGQPYNATIKTNGVEINKITFEESTPLDISKEKFVCLHCKNKYTYEECRLCKTQRNITSEKVNNEEECRCDEFVRKQYGVMFPDQSGKLVIPYNRCDHNNVEEYIPSEHLTEAWSYYKGYLDRDKGYVICLDCGAILSTCNHEESNHEYWYVLCDGETVAYKSESKWCAYCEGWLRGERIDIPICNHDNSIIKDSRNFNNANYCLDCGAFYHNKVTTE